MVLDSIFLAISSAADLSSFAVLVFLPESSKRDESNETTFGGRDGAILIFNAADPVPIATWLVNKAKGGSLAFLQVNQSSVEENVVDGKPLRSLLAYVNGEHEYILFDPHGKEAKELGTIRQDGVANLEEAGKFGYASIYGELPEFNPKRVQTSAVAPFVQSGKPWDTIFSGSSHNLPPLTKLCSAILESLLEKRTTVAE